MFGQMLVFSTELGLVNSKVKLTHSLKEDVEALGTTNWLRSERKKPTSLCFFFPDSLSATLQFGLSS